MSTLTAREHLIALMSLGSHNSLIVNTMELFLFPTKHELRLPYFQYLHPFFLTFENLTQHSSEVKKVFVYKFNFFSERMVDKMTEVTRFLVGEQKTYSEKIKSDREEPEQRLIKDEELVTVSFVYLAQVTFFSYFLIEAVESKAAFAEAQNGLLALCKPMLSLTGGPLYVKTCEYMSSKNLAVFDYFAKVLNSFPSSIRNIEQLVL